jgi:hypothetical protein
MPVVYQRLTDRVIASGVTPNDLIHIVITGDTSQDSNGSSYKATIQQVFDSYEDIFVTGGTYLNGNVTFTNNSGGTFNVTGFTISGDSTITTTEVEVSTYTATTTYVYYGVTFSGETNITLPNATNIDGFTIKIKDERGTASIYRIRVIPLSGTIDGNSYVDMNINYMSLTFVARNNNWWII